MRFAQLTLFFFCLFACQAQAQLPSYVPAAGIIGWWPLNGNLIDSSVNTNDGLGAGFTYETDRFGTAGKACSFLGTSSTYARFNDLPVNTRGTYTINYWMKLNGYREYGVVMDFHPSDACGGYPQVWQRFDSIYIVKCGIVPSRMALGSKDSLLKKWVMVTHLVKPDSTAIYINGAPFHKFPYTWDISTTANLIIGNAHNYSERYVTGSNVLLDDIGLWGRALTDCEITGLFDQTTTLSFSTQPITQTGNIGGSVSFSVTASNPLASYSWQSNIGTGGAYVDLTNNGQYSGVNTNTLTVSGLTSANSNQLFRCIAAEGEGLCASVTSNVASLMVDPTSIDDHKNLVRNVLEQNAPNPAVGATTINYHVPSFRNNASIVICDAGGRKVWTGSITKTGKGQFSLNPRALEQGIYFYSLIVDGQQISTKKMIIIN